MSDNARGVLPATYEGLVVDVILDHTHPQYSRVDGYNVGAIKVRIFDVNESLEDSQLPYADPIDTTILQYPLIGELVVIHKIRGNFFYGSKVAIARRIQENGMIGLNNAMNNPAGNTLSAAATNQVEISNNGHKFGEYFRPDSRVRQLKHFEGDTIFQGRMGNTIRFGSSQMDPSSEGLAPNIIIRAGQGKNIETESVSIDTVFGLVTEDINKDASSIWITSNQIVPFEPATIDAFSFFRSINEAPQTFDKAQIIINSDRVVLNSKANDIMLFSNKEIYLNSKSYVSIDTDRNILLTANISIINRAVGKIENTAGLNYTVNSAGTANINAHTAISLLSNKIYIGSAPRPLDIVTFGTSLADVVTNLDSLSLNDIPDLIGIGLDGYNLTAKEANTEAEPIVCGVRLAEWLDEILQVLITSPILGIASSGPVKLHPSVVLKLKTAQNKLYEGNARPSRFNLSKTEGRINSAFKDAIFNSRDNYVAYENSRPALSLIQPNVGLQLADYVIPVSTDIEKDTSQSGDKNNEWNLSDFYYKVI
jgi:hypothetical protein